MDSVLSKVHDLTLTGWPNHNADPELQPFFERRNSLSVEQGSVLWGIQVVIPEALRIRNFMRNMNFGNVQDEVASAWIFVVAKFR